MLVDVGLKDLLLQLAADLGGTARRGGMQACTCSVLYGALGHHTFAESGCTRLSTLTNLNCNTSGCGSDVIPRMM